MAGQSFRVEISCIISTSQTRTGTPRATPRHGNCAVVKFVTIYEVLTLVVVGCAPFSPEAPMRVKKNANGTFEVVEDHAMVVVGNAADQLVEEMRRNDQ